MKKRWLFILAVLMIAVTMFVACNSEVTDASASAQPGKELVYATFGNSSSKDLSVSYNFIDYTKLYWFYQATKKDHFGTTGEVTGDNWAKVPGDSEGKGLDGTVGAFSQGLWSFNLAGYETKSTTAPTSGDDYIQHEGYYYYGLVYSGASTGTVSLKYGDSNAIPVTVQPYGETGKIYLDGITYTWANPDDDPANVTLQIKVTPVEGSSWTDSKTWSYNSGYTLTDSVLNNQAGVDIPTGTYNLEFTVCAIVDNDVAYEFAEQSLSLTVFGSQTTTITGSLVEGLFVENAHFVATDVASVIVIPTTTGANFETDKTPAGSGGSKKTTVTVPTGTLTTGTQNNMTIELVSIDIAQDVASQKSWSVATDSSAVAALTITLKEVVTTTDPTTGSVTVEEKAITTFDKPVTVTTYIETGLTGVQVFYNGDLAQPTDVTYDATTGCLTFKTTHFSEFYVTSTSEVLNVDTGVKYTSLADAVDKAVAGQTLRLIKEVITDPGIEIKKSLVLDLYGNTWACTDVNPTKTNNRAVKITAGKVVITSSRDGGKITDGYYQTQYAEQDDYNKNDYNLLYGCIRVEKDGEVEINNVTLENFRGNGLNVKVIGGKATLDNVTINSIYGGGIEVTSVLWATKRYSVLPEEIGYAKLTNCTMTQDKYHDWCSVPVSVSGGADVDVYSTEYEGVYGVYVFSSGGTINIFGGSFTANGNTAQTPFVAKQVIKCAYDTGYDYPDYEHGGEHYSFSGSCNVNVYNGTINGIISTDSRSHVLAYGGTYDNNPSAYVAPGYYADTTVISGKWVVKPYTEAESHLSVTKGSSTVYMPIDQFRDSVNSGNSFEGYTVALYKDVDLNNAEWTPIGTEAHPFKGVFDGANHTIRNLTVTSHGMYSGLFGFVDGGDKHPTFGNAEGDSIGQKLSEVYDSSNYSMRDNLLTETIIESNYGAVIKNVNISGFTINCANGEDIENNGRYSGSLVGYAKSAFISNCDVSNGTVTGCKVFGGVVGVIGGSAVIDCNTSSDVTVATKGTGEGEGYNFGGIIGATSYKKDEFGYNAVINCTNNATLDHSEGTIGGYMAGIIGFGQNYQWQKPSFILGCTNNGILKDTVGSNVSGIASGCINVQLIVNCTNTDDFSQITGSGGYLAGIIDCANHNNLGWTAINCSCTNVLEYTGTHTITNSILAVNPDYKYTIINCTYHGDAVPDHIPNN